MEFSFVIGKKAYDFVLKNKEGSIIVFFCTESGYSAALSRFFLLLFFIITAGLLTGIFEFAKGIFIVENAEFIIFNNV